MTLPANQALQPTQHFVDADRFYARSWLQSAGWL